jgi:hypothetical protein
MNSHTWLLDRPTTDICSRHAWHYNLPDRVPEPIGGCRSRGNATVRQVQGAPLKGRERLMTIAPLKVGFQYQSAAYSYPSEHQVRELYNSS